MKKSHLERTGGQTGTPAIIAYVLRYSRNPAFRVSRSIVSTFWILEHGEDLAAPQRIVPDGHAELILNWSEPYEFSCGGEWHRQPRHFLAGQIEGPLLLRPTGPARMPGIGLHPEGAARLFGHPINELTGRFTALEDSRK